MRPSPILRWSLFSLTLLAAAATPSRAESIDLSKYDASSEIRVSQEGELIRVEWPVRDGSSRSVTLSLDEKTPLIREFSATVDGKSKPVLENVDPVTLLTVGTRDLTRIQGWMAFFDNPRKRPYETFLVQLERGEAFARSEGNRTIVSVGRTSAGPFSGNFQFTFYPGSPFVRAEAVMSTKEDARAIIYDAGLIAKDPSWKTMAWIDNRTDEAQSEPVEKEVDAEPLAVRYRTIAAQSENGALAVFPAPHQYFYPLDFSENYKFVWRGTNFLGKAPGYGFGVRQPPEGDDRWVPWFNAPPGTEQHLAVFYLLSPGTGEDAIQSVATYTRHDSYKPLPGYKTFTSHYHIEHTEELLRKREEQKTDGVPEGLETPGFVKSFHRLGVNIVHLGEFHFGDTPHWNLEKRLQWLKAMHEECARLSDDNLLVLPGEEPNVHLGGHWLSFFPKPVYWVLNRHGNAPFEQQVPGIGTVYSVGSPADVLKVMEKENGLMWTAHARLKGSTGFPDDYKETEFFKSPHFFGAAWKAMPADLSRDTLGWRVLDLLSDMNNWGYRKHILGEVDVFRFDPEFENYAHMNINYLPLDELPKFGDGWAPVLDALREGKYFVTTGEVLIPKVTIGGKQGGETLKLGASSSVPVEVSAEWTFPLAFIEVVSGDGSRIQRERIPLTTTTEFGSDTFKATVDLKGQKWARVEVWDIAANGAFTMPVWLE